MKQQQQQQQQTSSSAKVAVKTGGNHAENGHFVPSQSQTFKAPPPTVQPIASTDVAHAVRPQQFYHPGHVAHYAAPQPAPFDMQYYAVATPMQYNPYEPQPMAVQYVYYSPGPVPMHHHPAASNGAVITPQTIVYASAPQHLQQQQHHGAYVISSSAPTAVGSPAGSATAGATPPSSMVNQLGDEVTGAEDVTITCAGCNIKFLFSIPEQQFYIQRNYRLPLRCKPCRIVANNARTAARNSHVPLAEGDSMIGPCRSCLQPFVYSAGEREFFQERGYQEPVRCRVCRRTRRVQQGINGDQDEPSSISLESSISTSSLPSSASLEKLTVETQEPSSS